MSQINVTRGPYSIGIIRLTPGCKAEKTCASLVRRYFVRPGDYGRLDTARSEEGIVDNTLSLCADLESFNPELIVQRPSTTDIM
jgi:hypothetical protein